MALIDLPQSKWGSGTGRQVILKGDFSKIEIAALQVAELMPPPISEWVDATEIKVPTTADCPAKVIMSGFPNILHPGMVGGGLTDGRYRENIADVTLDFDLSASLWGSEKVSQWYLNYALAGNADEDFTLRAMPYMRVKSQASQVISLGTLVTPATGIGYGFTTDELAGGAIYVHTGDSRGLVRPITANNNDNGTGGTITYSGSALILAEGNWFAVLPPATNFRLTGMIFNNSAGNIAGFNQVGNQVNWHSETAMTVPDPAGVEAISCASPLAIAVGVMGKLITLGHPDADYATNEIDFSSDDFGRKGFAEVPIKNCRYKGVYAGDTPYAIYFKYPSGRGF